MTRFIVFNKENVANKEDHLCPVADFAEIKLIVSLPINAVGTLWKNFQNKFFE